MEKKGIKKMVTVAAASAAVGAGLGIMFAPKKVAILEKIL